jgi:ADP-ribose pyrophosphatase
MKKKIYKGRVVDLNLETVTLPNGATIELELIHHPGAAAIVPMKDENTIFMIRQYRYAAGGYLLEIPAGTLHPNEDPKDCAARELEEEIGFRALALDPVITFFTTPGFTNEVIHIFKATGLSPGRQNLDHDEVIEVIQLPLETAMTQIREGKIRDGKTIVGLQTVFLQSRKG